MELRENFVKVLTDEERKKYIKNGELSFGDDHDALIDFIKRWSNELERKAKKAKEEYLAAINMENID